MADTSQTNTHFDVLDPSDGSVIRSVEISDEAAVRAEMDRVRKASEKWSKTTIRERCTALSKVRDVISRRSDEIAELVCRENGKALHDSYWLDVVSTLALMNHFLEHAPAILAPERLHLSLVKHRRSYISYQPKGVVGIITPWNFPFFMPGSDVSMALLAGNGVLLKPSEVTPLSALLLKECYDEAGIDPDLFRVVNGFGPTGAALIDSQPDHVIFTGSVNVGRKIGVACAERLIPYTLELGGKAPVIVLEDADLELTANAITWGSFTNGGQICASIERVYAHESVYDELLSKVTQQTNQLRVGPSLGAARVDVGCLTTEGQRKNVENLISDALEKGATLMTGGKRKDDSPGLFFEPTVLADCDHSMAVMKEEIFGPIVPFMKVTSEREALKNANDSHLGLGGYVFTQDPQRGRATAEKLEVGSIMINEVVAQAGIAEMPWGGIKQSGFGFVRSERGLQALCNARHVNEERIRLPLKKSPLWFPYSDRGLNLVKTLAKSALGGTAVAKLVRTILR